MAKKPELRQLPVDQLSRGIYQPRREFDEHALAELAESIKSAGLIQPLVVRTINAKESRYEIIAGERRWRAAQLAGLATVPCLIREITDEQAAAVTTIENIQRQDLNPIEEAQAYSRLIEEFDYSHEEVAAVVGKSRSKVSNLLRLLKLEPRLKALLIEQKLNEGHGKVLAGLSERYQYPLALKCIEHEWSVRKLEREAKNIVAKGDGIQSGDDPNLRHLERQLAEQFGAKVKVEQEVGKRSGWLKLHYFNNETLAGLLDKMGIDYET